MVMLNVNLDKTAQIEFTYSLNLTYRFKQFNPNPDRTNTFIK